MAPHPLTLPADAPPALVPLVADLAAGKKAALARALWARLTTLLEKNGSDPFFSIV